MEMRKEQSDEALDYFVETAAEVTITTGQAEDTNCCSLGVQPS